MHTPSQMRLQHCEKSLHGALSGRQPGDGVGLGGGAQKSPIGSRRCGLSPPCRKQMSPSQHGMESHGSNWTKPSWVAGTAHPETPAEGHGHEEAH